MPLFTTEGFKIYALFIRNADWLEEPMKDVSNIMTSYILRHQIGATDWPRTRNLIFQNYDVSFSSHNIPHTSLENTQRTTISESEKNFSGDYFLPFAQHKVPPAITRHFRTGKKRQVMAGSQPKMRKKSVKLWQDRQVMAGGTVTHLDPE